MVTYERPINWTKANNYKHLALNKKQNKWKVREAPAYKHCVHFVVAMENATNLWSHVLHKQ